MRARLAAGLAVACSVGALAAASPRHTAADPPRSSAWLDRLPDGEAKRKFILDCAGCHQLDGRIARPGDPGRGQGGDKGVPPARSQGRFTEIELPVRDALPYVVRTDPRNGSLWIGTGAGDALLRYRPATGKFDVYPLPSRGALVRHLAVDLRNGAVWLAYGASPGIPARIARVLPR